LFWQNGIEAVEESAGTSHAWITISPCEKRGVSFLAEDKTVFGKS
jgi:hypothetical protein